MQADKISAELYYNGKINAFHCPYSQKNLRYDMLLGMDIHIFTDHKNLMLDTLKMHVLHWCTKIETQAVC
jgi:hypothetical protein